MNKNTNLAYIAFGANLSNPAETFLQIADAMGANGLVVETVSRLYQSPAWPPGSDTPDYLNAVLRVRTALAPKALMQLLLDIEKKLGRERSVRNAPRTCDLDLIDYEGVVSDDPDCTLPHPRMVERDFVLRPMLEVVEPDWRHPVNKNSVAELLSRI